jgi:Na+-driven multidrug efflux pump
LLSSAEKRFVRYWEEQRAGGRWSYYATYIAVGTLISTIILCTFLFLFFQIIFGSIWVWLAIVGSILISAAATITSWSKNEKKFRQIIRREMDDGVKKDIG